MDKKIVLQSWVENLRSGAFREHLYELRGSENRRDVMGVLVETMDQMLGERSSTDWKWILVPQPDGGKRWGVMRASPEGILYSYAALPLSYLEPLGLNLIQQATLQRFSDERNSFKTISLYIEKYLLNTVQN